MLNAIFTMLGSVAIMTGFMYAAKEYCHRGMIGDYNTNVSMLDTNGTAFNIFKSSIFIAIAFSTLGTVNGNILIQAWHGSLGLIFIYAAFKAADYVVLPDYDDLGAIIKDNNTSVAIMMGGYIVATGIIAFSSFVGTGPWWTSIVFFAIGQAILLGMGRIYMTMKPNLLKNIKDNQNSSGILLGGMFLAFAMILNGAIAGDFVSIEADLKDVAVSMAVGVGMFFVFINTVIDRLFVTTLTVEQMIETNNVGAISIIVTITIMLSIAIGYVVI